MDESKNVKNWSLFVCFICIDAVLSVLAGA